ncbi:MAG: endopeptidase La [Candidatus Promineifilaceae bacterium]
MSMTIGSRTVPAVPLRGGAVFPGGVTTISIGRKRSLKAAQVANKHHSDILILVQYDPDIENPTSQDMSPVGVLASVRDLMNPPQQGVQMLVELKRRVRFQGFVKTEPYIVGRYTEMNEASDGRPAELMASSIALLEEYAHMLGEVNRQVLANLRTKSTAGKLADYMAGLLNMPLDLEIELLTIADGEDRLTRVVNYLKQELHIAEIRSQIQQDARDGAEKAQREFLLREQMKAIRRELGDDNESVVDELHRKVIEVKMPKPVEERALKEIKRLERQGEQSAEASVIRTYLEWLTELPWNTLSPDNLDVDHVRTILDQDHYGLDDIKERIVEYVAVRKLAGSNMRGAIINLDGPPGVGKTSIASSVARAMGREMTRISLGGVRDEAEIRGHRRTYIGAIPGRIIRALRDCKTRNPVIVLDEIDKVGRDWRGDPTSALLEVLDPEQNGTFADHYLELPFDLTQVVFITTSNTTSTIPDALRDRMEVLSMSGYIEDEKVEITRGYLLSKQLKAHGVSDYKISFSDAAIRKIIRHYTYEAGVRQLERHIGTMVRKVAVQIARGETGPFRVTIKQVEEYLGPERFQFGRAEEKDEVGVVTGLAVVGYGSDTLAIEVRLSEGSGRMQLTGSLGQVMKESAETALTFVRSNARTLEINPKIFDKVNIHVHVPAGGIPKEGPSAGIALTTAIISAFTNRPVRKDVAMTGEVTLRGKVLPIGGLKAKSIAAHRAGIKTAIFPKRNAKDIPDIPEKVKQDLQLIPVAHVDEVIKHALLSPIGKPFGQYLLSEDELKIPPPERQKTSNSGVRA